MKQKIVVIGCGHVGLSYVEKMAAQPNLNVEIVLIDQEKETLKGEILDLDQGLSLMGSVSSIRIGDYEDCKDASIICLTAGVEQSMHDRLDDLQATNEIVRDIVKQVMEHQFQGIFLVASNPVDVISYLVSYYADYSYQKVIGTGTMLDTARLKTLLSKQLLVKPEDITAFVLGEHGNSQFVAWNNANVGLQNLQMFLSLEEKEAYAKAVKEMGSTIVSYKGHTSHGVAYCLVRLSLAILLDEKCIYPVSCYQDSFDVYLSTPAVIGKDGIERKINMKLTEVEKEKLLCSAKIMKEAIAKILPPELY